MPLEGASDARRTLQGAVETSLSKPQCECVHVAPLSKSKLEAALVSCEWHGAQVVRQHTMRGTRTATVAAAVDPPAGTLQLAVDGATTVASVYRVAPPGAAPSPVAPVLSTPPRAEATGSGPSGAAEMVDSLAVKRRRSDADEGAEGRSEALVEGKVQAALQPVLARQDRVETELGALAKSLSDLSANMQAMTAARQKSADAAQAAVARVAGGLLDNSAMVVEDAEAQAQAHLQAGGAPGGRRSRTAGGSAPTGLPRTMPTPAGSGPLYHLDAYAEPNQYVGRGRRRL